MSNSLIIMNSLRTFQDTRNKFISFYNMFRSKRKITRSLKNQGPAILEYTL